MVSLHRAGNWWSGRVRLGVRTGMVEVEVESRRIRGAEDPHPVHIPHPVARSCLELSVQPLAGPACGMVGGGRAWCQRVERSSHIRRAEAAGVDGSGSGGDGGARRCGHGDARSLVEQLEPELWNEKRSACEARGPVPWLRSGHRRPSDATERQRSVPAQPGPATKSPPGWLCHLTTSGSRRCPVPDKLKRRGRRSAQESLPTRSRPGAMS